MENYGPMIRSTFDMGSVRDANALFEAVVKNAFPSLNFRRLELIRFIKENEYMEGRSWNHVFEIQVVPYEGQKAWYVQCRRVTLGKTPEKHVYLDYTTLDFLSYDLNK